MTATAIRHIHEDFTRLLLNAIELANDRPADSFPENEPPQLAQCLLEDAWRERATDIHIDPQSGGYRIRLRIDGSLHDAAFLTENQAHRLNNQFKTWANLNPVTTFHAEEARWSYELDDDESTTLHLRLTGMPCMNGEKLSIRLLDPNRIEHRLHDLGLRDNEKQRIESWLNLLRGMFLVTGPTGSGKTTTLYALLHELKSLERSILTIEDPVEYLIDGIAQIQIDRRHELDFGHAVKSMLRLDPDYLMVGEVRDSESARASVDASVGGRAVMTTLHAPDAVGAVTSLRNWGLKNHEIAVNLSVVVAQRLVRTLHPDDREQRGLSATDRQWFEHLGIEPPQSAWYPKENPTNSANGYKGRTGVFEVWRIDEDDYDHILAGEDEYRLYRHLQERDHHTLLDDAMDKLREGLTTVEEVQRVTAQLRLEP